MSTTFRVNMDLIRPLLDEDLRNTIDRIQPKVDRAVNDAIDEYEKSVAKRINRFREDINSDAELRAAMEKAFEETDASFKETNELIDELIVEIKSVLDSAEKIQATAVEEGAGRLLEKSQYLQNKVNSIRETARKATRVAVSAGLKALGLAG